MSKDKGRNLPHRAFGSDLKGRYRDWLVRTVRERGAALVAEVGVLSGTTTLRLAEETEARIVAVDHWRGVPGDPLQAGIYRQPQKSKKIFYRRLGPFIEAGRVRVFEMDSVRAASEIATQEGAHFFDLVFLDADHSYDAVREDIWAWRGLVKPGGLLCGHDYKWPRVREAVTEALGSRHVPACDGFCWQAEIGP